VNGIADYLYLVDSFGGVFPEDVRKMIGLVKSKTDVKLGFHGHNNLELALANTLIAMEEGVDIVDGTITGMGRGAGNLKTELLLSVLNSKRILDFDYNQLSRVTDPFEDLQKHYGWGTSLPYIVSGANSIPQKQVMEWVTRRYYSFNSIIRALSNQSKGVEDNEKLPGTDFIKRQKHKCAFIVGGGPSAIHHSEAIRTFLTRNPEIVLIHASSKNALAFKECRKKQYFCLVGNEGHRLERVFGQLRDMDAVCILPPYPRKMGTYIPESLKESAFELSTVQFMDQLHDAHTTIAIQTAIELGVDELLFAGYDGYSGESISEREQELFNENEFTFAKAKNAGLTLKSLTPTKYRELDPSSVYATL